jgi:lysophospholipase L1-like esterase
MMKFCFLVPLFLFSLAISAHAQSPAREDFEWCDIWLTHVNDTNLPRVLLIGDSISKYSFPEVEKELAGKAYVNRLSTSAFATDPVLLTPIAPVLDNSHFDVIVFNNGMHGWQHSEQEYEATLPSMLDAIRKHAPSAKLIWADTTAIKQEPDSPTGTPSGVRIKARNAIADKLMQDNQIPVINLYDVTSRHPELHSDNIHFNDQGTALIGGSIVSAVQKLLP